MSLQWVQIIVGILTILAALGGGGMMLWLLNKPKVSLLSKPIGKWYFTYKDGKERDKSEIILLIALQNRGVEDTSIIVKFTTKLPQMSHKSEYVYSEAIRLPGNTAMQRFTILLGNPTEEELPREEEILYGTLELEPLGNKRMFLGKKLLPIDLEIPYSQYPTLAMAF